uniref:Uncharacterized protein n=1 Tax=Meloidogyne javanica TaxID=6303 RepID=A0A915LRZ1_MELJA
MNKKLFFLTTLSIHVILFNKSSAKVALRAKKGEELELPNNETLPTGKTGEEKSDNNITTTEGNIEGSDDEIEEEKAGHSTAPITKNSVGENKNNETVEFDGKNCILTEGKGIAYKTKVVGEYTNEYTNYSIEVREKKTIENVNIVGTPKNYFKKLANCRTTNYRRFSYCARLKFFGSKGINIVKNSTLFVRNNPKNISEYKKNYMQDMALVMIEGCVICGNSSNQIITIKFIQLHPKMQGLSINLTRNSTEETYDWEETWAESLIPIKVAELKTSTELVPTIETVNKTTETSNTPKEKETAHPTQPEIPDGPDFVELDGEQPGEEEEEENDQNNKDEIKQGETNVVEGIYLEETTHSVDEGKEEEENKNDEMNTSRPEEVSTKIEEINEEKENEYEKEEVNEKMEEKERKKEIKESKGSEEENESKLEKQDMSKDAFINS